MRRRTLLSAVAAAIVPRFAIGRADNQSTLKFVPAFDLSALDPIAVNSNVTRNHGYMVYDQLYGADAQFQPHPQMAEGHVFDDDGKTCTITLREGLFFHDGEPVRSSDAVQSLKRWMVRSPFGDKLRGVINEITVLDDRRFQFRLKRRFPFLIAALGSPPGPPPFIMPERIAQTDPFRPFKEVIGSGPFRFKADEYRIGTQAAYEKYEKYSPTPDRTTGLTAGPKLANFQRVEWRTLDHATAAEAMQAGEIDWQEEVTPELQEMLKKLSFLRVETLDPLPLVATLRLNRSQPPFSDKRLAQALLPSISQADYMQAVIGTDPSRYITGVGFFTPGSIYASDAGLQSFQGPRELEKSRSLLREIGFDQTIRLLGTADIMSLSAETQMTVDLFRQLNLKTDLVMADWGTVLQRRENRGPLDKGGWSAVCFANSGMDFYSPATNNIIRGNGQSAYYGWPDVPRLEELRDKWFEAPDVASQQAVTREIQMVAMQELPSIPLGGYYSYTAIRQDLQNRVPGFAMFWGIRRV